MTTFAQTLFSKSVIVALGFGCTPAFAITVLNFEELNPGPATYALMPSSYAGLTFSGWYFGPDTQYKPASGVIDLFTNYANPADPDAYVFTVNNAITAKTPFVFSGASFSGYSGVTFELYLAGALVHTSASLPDATGDHPYLPIFLASGYNQQVDKVTVKAVQGFYSMDNFTFQAVVPEPSTYMLLMAGVGVVGWAAGRRRRQ